MVALFGGRRRLAAVVLSVISLLVVIGPATWLVLGLIDSLRILSERLDLAALTLPPPPEIVKSWPLIGEPIYQFWELASNNLKAALVKIAPQLKPLGGALLHVGGGSRHRRGQILHCHHPGRISVFAGPRARRRLRRFSRRIASGAARSSSGSPATPSGRCRAA